MALLSVVGWEAVNAAQLIQPDFTFSKDMTDLHCVNSVISDNETENSKLEKGTNSVRMNGNHSISHGISCILP